MVVGLLHPGEMGAALGALLRGRGHDVVWASAGRSAATAGRARGAGLHDAGGMADVVGASELIVSICPPHAAVEMADSVAGLLGRSHRPRRTGATPSEAAAVYLDANAIAPATAAGIAGVIEGAGGRYVDGGVIGPPPREPGLTRLYLSGEHAPAVAEAFAGSGLETPIVAGGTGAASALKMAYAAWTKGTAALLLAIRSLAREEGVEEALLAEWERSQPGLGERLAQAAASADGKGWRWIGEMEEIAATMEAAGLPSGFHAAAAEIFRRGGA